jgi:hypothetical protein
VSQSAFGAFGFAVFAFGAGAGFVFVVAMQASVAGAVGQAGWRVAKRSTQAAGRSGAASSG